MNVLIADDEKQMLSILRAYFEKEGFQVDTAGDGQAALNLFYEKVYDLVILDWMMQKGNGIATCREMKEKRDTKILLLTAKSEVEDEIIALEAGADDYLRKPFHPRVLIARAKRLVRSNQQWKYGDITINFEAKKIYRKDVDLMATRIEFELVKCLATHKGQILSRKQLLDRVWGLDYIGEERTVDTHIRRVREKVGEYWIKTHRGIGYSWEDNHE
ncbi:response regulator transcription factor [Shimazuella kribbensis]|uniref:response regulator transcription factor n=1 Tax=Shimazuella kribbensis TaxID=139808 RepID=UPI00048ED157|nr:response regulator transcription factor [Shimazuella kribbensis]